VSALLAAALAWIPPWRSPEPTADYRARVFTIVEAVERVTVSPAERAAVLVTLRAESGFAPAQHAGDHRPDSGRAMCLGSVHRDALSPSWGLSWGELAGTDAASTERCALATLLVLRRAAAYCRVRLDTRHGVAVASRLYLTGSSCVPCPEALRRAGMWAAVVAKVAP